MGIRISTRLVTLLDHHHQRHYHADRREFYNRNDILSLLLVIVRTAQSYQYIKSFFFTLYLFALQFCKRELFRVRQNAFLSSFVFCNCSYRR